MSVTTWRQALSDLRTWKRGSTRAVHKPLLTLMLIARASRGEANDVTYAEIAEPLAKLLKEFGPNRTTYHPEFPFWHLRSDGFWVVRDADSYPLKKGGSSPSKGTLLKHEAAGFVKPELWESLVSDPKLQAELADMLLVEFWPETLHGALRLAVGLPDLGWVSGRRRKRDARFREDVLRAYRSECVVCSFDGRLSGVPLGIEAAHVRWHAYGGADTVSNGLALCNFHHLALDTGAMGIDPQRRILVSCDVSGSRRVEELLYRYEGREIREPQPGIPGLSDESIKWHGKEVFKSPGRGWSVGKSGGSFTVEPGP